MRRQLEERFLLWCLGMLAVAALVILAGTIGGCANGALYGTDEYNDKALIVQLFKEKGLRYSQRDVDTVYARAMARYARELAAMPPPAYLYAGDPYAFMATPYTPPMPDPFAGALMPRRGMNCMQYGTLGQGGQFSCW